MFLVMENLAGYQGARIRIEKFIGEPLTHDFVKGINATVIGAESSNYREIGVCVRNRTRRQVYSGPFPEWVPNLMTTLLDWLNTEKDLPVAVIVAIFHWRFLKIHPFCIDEINNGNGRTARLLSTFILLSSGYDAAYCYALEDFFEQNKDEYYAALEGSLFWDQNEDTTGWIKYFLLSMSTVREMRL